MRLVSIRQLRHDFIGAGICTLFIAINLLHAAERDQKAEKITQTMRSIEQKTAFPSKGKPSNQELKELQTNIEILKENPNISASSLVKEISDVKKNKSYRLICITIAEDMALKKAFSKSDNDKLSTAFISEIKDDEIKTEIAGLLLSSNGPIEDNIREKIREYALSQLKGPQTNNAIYSRILKNMKRDSEIENILLPRLHEKADKNNIVYALGKIGSIKALREIEKQIDAGEGERSFVKTRAYYAIGEIGGEEAYDCLMRFFNKENDPLGKKMIVASLGATKSTRAKNQLLSLLKKKADDYFFVALDGLKYLSDPSVVPQLERIKQNEPDNYRKMNIEKTIAAIEAGENELP